MSISQLIATQYGRNAGPSPIEQLSGLETLKRQKLTNQSIESDSAQNKVEQGMKFAANVGRQIKAETDPARKAQIYQSARKFAEMNNYDLSAAPEQYDEQAQYMLDVAEAQVYEPQKIMQFDQVAAQLPEEHRSQFMALAQIDPRKATDFASSIMKPQKSLVTINNAEEKGLTEEQKALAKSRVSRFQGMQETAQNAINQNETLAQLKNIDVATGFGEEAKVGLARAFNALGANGDELLNVNVANTQAFNSKSKALLADLLAAQKGVQTDKDAERLSAILPLIKNEQQSNEFIVESLMEINSRKVEQAQFYEKILEEQGTLRDADKRWREYMAKTPLVSASVKNPDNGLPMFFGSFEKKAKEANPDATREQIVNAWRKLNK